MEEQAQGSRYEASADEQKGINFSLSVCSSSSYQTAYEYVPASPTSSCEVNFQSAPSSPVQGRQNHAVAGLGSIDAVIANHVACVSPVVEAIPVPPPMGTKDGGQPFTPTVNNKLAKLKSLGIPHGDQVANTKALKRIKSTGDFPMPSEPIANFTHTDGLMYGFSDDPVEVEKRRIHTAKLCNTYSDTNPLEVNVVYNGDASDQDATLTAAPRHTPSTPIPASTLAHPAMASFDTWPEVEKQAAAFFDPYDTGVAKGLGVFDKMQREAQNE